MSLILLLSVFNVPFSDSAKNDDDDGIIMIGQVEQSAFDILWQAQVDQQQVFWASGAGAIFVSNKKYIGEATIMIHKCFPN